MPTQYYRRGMLGGVGVTNKFVCFSCRQCFHTQRSPKYPTRDENPLVCSWPKYERQDGHKCPSCSAPMWYAGSFFRAPRKTAKREWKRLEQQIKVDGRIFSR